MERVDFFEYDDTPREECGVFSAISLSGVPKDINLATETYIGLSNLQHRGEDAAGMGIYNGRYWAGTKEQGLVSNVFNEGTYLNGFAPGYITVGHVRYGTAGEGGFEAAHPHRGDTHGFLLSLNGHNRQMEDHTGSKKTDTEVLVRHVDERMTEVSENLEDALLHVLRGLNGGYSLTASDEKNLIGARDPWGFRPLCLGRKGDVYFFSSEDSAFRDVDETVEVAPGEMVIIGPEGVRSELIYAVDNPSFCAMEESYIARPDTTFEGRNVQQTRMRKGKFMAQQEAPDFAPDVVIGVPESGLDDAAGYAEEMNIPLRRALLKNPYISRTFIKSSQEKREIAAEQKIRVVKQEVVGKHLVVVDDSMVRGTVGRVVIRKLRDAGAASVHLRIMFPPHRYPCFYGIDTGDSSQLLANRMSHQEMVDHLGVDSLMFITPENLREAISPKMGGLCMACVTGEYPTEMATISAESLFARVRD